MQRLGSGLKQALFTGRARAILKGGILEQIRVKRGDAPEGFCVKGTAGGGAGVAVENQNAAARWRGGGRKLEANDPVSRIMPAHQPGGLSHLIHSRGRNDRRMINQRALKQCHECAQRQVENSDEPHHFAQRAQQDVSLGWRVFHGRMMTKRAALKTKRRTVARSPGVFQI
ncbi:MAG TPA: hypothetical protein VFV96_18830 [Verrucomicrobiae bacterium]|nr:hypothetical protein [Verrucomicrobiae bacterium]